ncbi:MAG: lipoprotein-releasing ABC transporter permease subunit [Rhodospirillaceae bacterium]|nr:lipoprotein-releasing ABC transporter permease subunit [Rhodospirillaceae bacterium]
MRQPYEISMALRYLRVRGKNGFISFISLVSMVGIGLAVAVLIVVLSVMNGFEHELRQRILNIVSHATISGVESPLEDWRSMRDSVLASPEVIGVAPYVDGQGLLMAEEALAGVQVRGIDPAIEPDVSAIATLLGQGSLEDLQPGAYRTLIGTALARELDVGVGDSVVLVLAQGTVTPVGLRPRTRLMHVAGTFEAGMFEYDRGLIYVHLEDAARLFRTGGEATGLRLAVTDIFRAGSVAAQLARVLGGGFYVGDWSRQHVNFFRSIQLTKSIMFVIFSLVIAVAVFNILSTLVMVVRDKRSDIAILQSFGASPRSITTLFATQGTLIGVIGTAFGVALGILVASQLGSMAAFVESVLGIDLLSEEVYFISDLPTDIRPAEVVQIALLAVLLAISATLYPAFSASRQPPVEALRHE